MSENFIYLVIVIFSVSLVIIIKRLNQLKQDLSHANSALNKITEGIGLVDIPIENMDIEELKIYLKRLILKGKKIEAIKMYRAATGRGLKEAKDYINNLD